MEKYYLYQDILLMWILIYIHLGVYLVCASSCNASSIQTRTFFKVDRTDLGSERLGSPWIDDSLATCSMSCINQYSSRCQTIMYNRNTGLCTPGSFLKFGLFGTALAPSNSEGDLFAPTTCDTSDGFSLIVSGTLKACVKISDDAMIYSKAYAFCLNLGAHLYVSRSIAGFDILPQGNTYLIGLTDIDSESNFVWQDTGSTISASFKTLLFSPGEPNNIGDEDCVIIRTGGALQSAYDFSCEHYTHKFVCERPMQV